VQRLARRLRAPSQAIDATNEMALRVMVRQVSKLLGGLDITVFAAGLGEATGDSLALAARYAGREMARDGGGALVVALPDPMPVVAGAERVRVVTLDLPPQPDEAWAREALAGLIL
jgi:NAD(P)-dependent dehydrogenase (short-subunit alcohol dehydrogenase family)